MDTENHDHFKTIALAQAGQQADSLKPQKGENSSLGQDPAYCLRKAEMIFSCYRKDEVQNPEMYTAAVAAVLSEYPKSIVDYICDPRTGITGKQTWPPSVAEIKTACENKYNQILQSEESRLRRERQLQERETWENKTPSGETGERLKQMGADWLSRKDVKSQELSGQKPKLQEDPKKLLANAAKTGKEFSGMKLRPETLGVIRERDALKQALGGELKDPSPSAKSQTEP